MKYLIPILTRYSSILVQFWILVLISRTLNSADAGIFFVLSGIVLTAYFAVSFGIPDGFVLIAAKQISLGRNQLAKLKVRSAAEFSLLITVPVCIVIAMVISKMMHAPMLGTLAGIWLLGYCLCFISAQALIAINRIKTGTFVFYSAINVLLAFTTIPYLSIASHPNLESTVAWIAFPSFFAGCLSILYCWLSVFRSSKFVSLKRKAKIGLTCLLRGGPISLGRLVQSALIWSPVWIAGVSLSIESTAQVGLATRLFGVFGAMLAAIRFSVRPQIAQLAASNNWKCIEYITQKIAFAASLFVLISLIVATTAGRDLIPLLFGQTYNSTWSILLIMFGASFGESMGGPVDEVLKMTGSALHVLYMQVLSLLILWPLGLAFSWIFGPHGIAIAFASTVIFLYSMLIIHLFRKHEIFAIPSAKGYRQ
ncbi:lipopolysaccharide biosynthesis protein [Hydrogenophaga taeniospiralis]|uniref:lipopolysaccharide biosynthesis protein n=1 Tax=Hydrogenophaga taeniospiralis TaxID=65656 RepID=UPI001CFADC94|nr:hypothetical protein [Hydrogenophaga taeniospiralis]UCU94175.1 hypothetical protein KI616_26140 [Hydrogenophaga taeniospiralis]